jgi:hypothetical protein
MKGMERASPGEKVGEGIGMVLGMFCFGALVGAPFGLIIRSLRGWLFVLTLSIGLGLFVMIVGALTTKPMTTGGPVGDFCAGAAIGALGAWLLALPIKGVLWIIQYASART